MVVAWRARAIAASSVASCSDIRTRVALVMSMAMPTIITTGRTAKPNIKATLPRRSRRNF